MQYNADNPFEDNTGGNPFEDSQVLARESCRNRSNPYE